MRGWIPALAAAAVLIVMIAVVRRGGAPARSLGQPSQPSVERQVATASPARAPALPLDKPDVKLTSAALVLRSAGRDARFVDDIAPALDAYRANDYVEADRRFVELETRYPKSVEVTFYRAIAQLFLDDPRGALLSLQAARRIDDDSFAPEIAWYLAVAYERAGDSTRARSELDSLCRGSSAYAPKACDAAAKRNTP
jgi:predicted Zn-dependent protease